MAYIHHSFWYTNYFGYCIELIIIFAFYDKQNDTTDIRIIQFNFIVRSAN